VTVCIMTLSITTLGLMTLSTIGFNATLSIEILSIIGQIVILSINDTLLNGTLYVVFIIGMPSVVMPSDFRVNVVAPFWLACLLTFDLQ
jgi:hypothetical protein